jgi:hypothetical protein
MLVLVEVGKLVSVQMISLVVLVGNLITNTICKKQEHILASVGNSSGSSSTTLIVIVVYQIAQILLDQC